MSERATISTHGRVTVPKGVRDRLGLRAGDKVEFTERDGAYVMTAVSRLEPWLGYLKDLEGVDVDALVDEMRGR